MTRLVVHSADEAPTTADFRSLLGEYFAHLALMWPRPNPARWQHELDGLPGVFARPGGRMLVAYVDGEPAGIVALVGQDGGACEVKRLFVRPPFRRLGVSRVLMARVLAEAAEAGYTVMRLGTSPDFAEAIALYESLGFEHTARFREGFGDDMVFMARRLDADG